MDTTYAVLALGLGYLELKALAHATLYKKHCQVALMAAFERRGWKQNTDSALYEWRCPHWIDSIQMSPLQRFLALHASKGTAIWLMWEFEQDAWPYFKFLTNKQPAQDLLDIVNTLVPPCNH
jgi:hypothetical protein